MVQASKPGHSSQVLNSDHDPKCSLSRCGKPAREIEVFRDPIAPSEAANTGGSYHDRVEFPGVKLLDAGVQVSPDVVDFDVRAHCLQERGAAKRARSDACPCVQRF